jgi:hypothetical protein
VQKKKPTSYTAQFTSQFTTDSAGSSGAGEATCRKRSQPEGRPQAAGTVVLVKQVTSVVKQVN